MFGDATETHIPIENFLEIINSHHETFTVEEVQFLFQILKSPGSDYIDKMRLLLYATNSGWVDIENIEHNRKLYSDHMRDLKKHTIP